jgi:hypothetical protein
MYQYNANVQKVVDGDTMEIDIDLIKRKNMAATWH